MRHTSYCLLFALLSVLSFSVHAQTTWNGSIDSDWFNAGNWSSGVPAAGNDAIIPMGFITEINLTGDTDFLFKVDNSGMIFVKLNGHFLTFHDDVLIQNTGLISVENTGTGALVNLADWTNNGAVVVTPCTQFLAQNNSTVTGTGTFANHGIVYKIGSATVVVTDGNGVVLTDLNQSPTPDAKCVPALLVPLDANDQAALSPSDVDDGSAAPYCAIQDYALSKTNFDCSDVGDNQVILMVTDKLGNTGSCMTTVTIQDTVPPVITCPASLNIDLNPGECDRVVEFDFLISASDNCGSPALAQTDATGLSSGDAFPIGTTWLMFEASDGTNTDQCTFSVNINEFVPASSGLACHQQINISLGPDCEETLTPAHILSGEYGCFDDFVVTIDETGTNHIDDTFLGQLVTIRVKSLETGNTCWGLGLVEEKLPPKIDNCDPVSIVCMQNPAPTTEGGDIPTPDFYDCSGIQLAYYVDEMTSGGCGETYQMMINRIWTFVDNHDNVSSCEQLITIERASLQNQSPQCPPDYSIECSLNSTPDFSPEVTGYPVFSFGGQDVPIKTNQASVCGLTASYSDEVLPKCGAAYRIIRTWLVADWCLPMDGMINPWTCKQTIDLTDTTPPVVLTPGDLSISPDSDCKAFPILPPAQVSDCSDVTVVTLTPVGPIAGNGGPVPVPGLGIGTHEIVYKATDPCGNFTLDTILVTVEDNLEPYMICIQNTVVGLSNDGVAYSFPESFDNGSYDNCGPIDLVVRRMDAGCFADTSFQDFVRFCCDDIGQTIMVVVRGYDWFGHYSECMVEVQVQDKINPVIQCPPNLTIDCEQDFNDFDLTGEVVNNPNDQTPIDGIAFDNCDMADISFTTVENIDCGQGTVVRTWTATDMGGVEVSCNQIITIVNTSPYDGSGIIWPSDTSMVNCNALTNPVITGEPVVPAGNACSNIVVGHEDEILQIVQGACLKVLRTWTVIDWCQYDPNVPNSPGRWSWTQTIKVIDDEPPVFESCDDLTFCNFKADCGPLGLDLSVHVTDACTGDDSIDLTWEVDENNDGSVDATGDGQHQGGLYAVGTHQITYYASDGCGNTATCSFRFTIEDCKKPTVFCQPVTVEVMQTGAIQIWASDFDAGSFDNCTSVANLELSFSSDKNDKLKTYTCNDIGLQNVEMWVTDEAGNQDFCQTTITIQDNMNTCGTQDSLVVHVGGLIANWENESVENVMVEVSNGNAVMQYTDQSGTYEFSNIPMGYDYTITPSLNEDHRNGVTTYDLVLLNRHILGVQKLDSPYKLIAADVNHSGTITVADMVDMRKLILFVVNEFPSNTSWRFVAADYVFPDPANPFATDFPEVMNINDLDHDMMTGDFVAVKIGDLNGTAQTYAFEEDAEDRGADETLTFYAENKSFSAGKTFRVPFTSDKIGEVLGYQFTLNFDTDRLELADILPGEKTTFDNFGQSLLDEGILTTSWINAEGQATGPSANGLLFTLVFRAKADGELKDALWLNSLRTPAEACHSTMKKMEVSLAFRDERGTVVAPEPFILYQNIPNPFKDETVIGFNLPEATTVTLKIFDLNGKVIRTQSVEGRKGYNAISVKQSELKDWNSGVLFYQLETPEQVASRKMTLMK